MKTNKRFLALAAISIALAFTFPGCSSDGGGGSSDPGSSSSGSGGDPVAIASVSIHVTAPATGETPSGTATTTEAGYSVGTVQWSPSHPKFLGSTAYTATVTLTASEGYTFTGLATAKIDGHDAAASGNTGGTVTLSYAFAATSKEIVTGISIKTQPSKLAYTHGEELDLSGLEVTLAYNDGTSKDVASSDFEDNDIETDPYDGETLKNFPHDGKGVKVEYGDHLSANTASLTVACEEHDAETQFCDGRDGKIYNKVTITIGTYSKTWMAENLNYATESGSWCYAGIENTTGTSVTITAEQGCAKYGRLYDWATAMNNAASSAANPSGVQGVCPEGWHLPSNAEWTALTTAIGGTSGGGAKLKAASGWRPQSGISSTDEYGFSALPGGYRSASGSFSNAGSIGDWWSSTQYFESYAYFRLMYYGYGYVNSSSYGKSFGYSVRCQQD
jgi:uncharacterized protein (TIGR02145 family)